MQRLTQYFPFENVVVVAIKWNQRDVKEEAVGLSRWVDIRALKREKTSLTEEYGTNAHNRVGSWAVLL